MHIHRIKSKSGSKVYEKILLRESYRERVDGRSTVKKRTLLNLTKHPPEIIQAIELPLKDRNDLSALTSIPDIEVEQGLSDGGVYPLFDVARRLGIEKALGTE